MRIIITDSYEEMGMEAANIVAGQIYLKPNSVLGLATGSTPVSMYQRLAAVHKTVGLDFSEVTTFNLDEYIGMSPENPQSYHYFMQENFFKHININQDNVFIPDGMAEDMIEEGERYERLIEAKGGIDLQVLGIGQNAHIGFNEPDIKFAATTHKV
ncbi:glucosamine-6-phosphate deaminase, partial [Anaerovibrio sp.]|uniref:glucosamine-6-phosphate deaminase n=1 Tax=Anaerovibrio sp. TaxID=1872532 RepID=UPI00388F04B4